MNSTFEELFHYIQSLEIIDTHEHLPAYEDKREQDTDILKEYLTHYFNCDLISSGLSEEAFETVIDNRKSLMKRWELVEPYWENSRYTGYGQALDISVRALYGIDGINRKTIEELNEAFVQSLQPGHFHKVLKEKSKIRLSVLNDLENSLESDPRFFRNVFRIDHLIIPKCNEDIRAIEEESGVSICSFENYLEACSSILEKAIERKSVGLKLAIAYQRTLHFERTTKNEAESCFNVIFSTKHIPEEERGFFTIGRAFQDYILHYILNYANRNKITIQIHTGIQEGNGNLLSNSNPILLSNLFLEYPEVPFDIFHMGIPFEHSLTVLAKNFPNVYIDMCWAHIVSPKAAVSALNEWIESVPFNKISVFGGDYCFIDGVYGHQYLARKNVSESLSLKVAEGLFGMEEARSIARMLFVDNPTRLFNLAEPDSRSATH